MTSMNAQHVGKSGKDIPSLFLTVVVTAEFFLDWNTAWTTGGFFIALVALSWGKL